MSPACKYNISHYQVVLTALSMLGCSQTATKSMVRAVWLSKMGTCAVFFHSPPSQFRNLTAGFAFALFIITLARGLILIFPESAPCSSAILGQHFRNFSISVGVVRNYICISCTTTLYTVCTYLCIRLDTKIHIPTPSKNLYINMKLSHLFL